MTVLPVIARELRASARQPFTYYLRVLGVTALLLASLLFGLHYGFEPGLGRLLFGGPPLHALRRDLGPGADAHRRLHQPGAARRNAGAALPDAVEGDGHRRGQRTGARIAGDDA